MNGKSTLDWALTYMGFGWSVLPLHSWADGCCTCGKTDCTDPAKHPLSYYGGTPVLPLGEDGKAGWKPFQDRVPSEAEVREWWTAYPWANIAVVTGKVSGLVVCDVDGTQGVESVKRHGGFPRTPNSTTGKGGHAYFEHPGYLVKNLVKEEPGLDVRGDGGYVVAPPSKHASGRTYRWSKEPGSVPIAEMPDWFSDLVNDPKKQARGTKQRKNPDGWVQELLKGCSEGGRNQACIKLAGYYLRLGLTPEQVEALLMTWNRQNKPPLDEDEVREACMKIVARCLAEKNQSRNFAIENVLVVETEEPLYYIRVFGTDVQLTAVELLNFGQFQARVMARCQQVPQFKNPQANWKPYVHECLQKLAWIPAPAEASHEEMLWAQIARYLSSRSSTEESVLAEHRGVYSNETLLWFHGPTVYRSLQSRNIQVAENRFWDMLRKRGAESKPKKVKNSEGKWVLVRAWSIPKDSVAAVLPEGATGTEGVTSVTSNTQTIGSN